MIVEVWFMGLFVYRCNCSLVVLKTLKSKLSFRP